MSRPDPISLRLPDDLKKRLQAAHEASGRSMNAEIRMRLEWSFEAGFSGEATDKMLASEVETLRSELRGGLSNLQEQVDELKKRFGDEKP